MLQFTLLTGAAALSTSHDRPPATLARRAFLGTTTCVPLAAYAACLPGFEFALTDGSSLVVLVDGCAEFNHWFAWS